MAIPSGAGTEVAWKGTIHNQSTDVTSFRWDRTLPSVGTETDTVPANHIYTIISFSICRDGGTLTKITVRINDGTSDRVILFEEGLSEQTFIWNDRIVLMPGNVFKFQPNGTSSMQYWISYIDQDWS